MKVPVTREGSAYVARITGTDPKYRFARTFLKDHILHGAGADDWFASVPSADGTYEVGDFFPDGTKRRRYYYVATGATYQLANFYAVDQILDGIPIDRVKRVLLTQTDTPTGPKLEWEKTREKRWEQKNIRPMNIPPIDSPPPPVEPDLLVQVREALLALGEARAAIKDPIQDDEDVMMHLEQAQDALEKIVGVTV